MNTAIARREVIEAQLRAAPKDDVATLHPSVAERYRQKVAETHGALRRGDPASRADALLIQNLESRLQ